MKASRGPLAERLAVVPLVGSGHSSLQEAPPLLATIAGPVLSGEV
ncbi:MAG TPA: hypothetical protein VFS43_42275 [Polyangiaceae bacterium]|nr:hypothetical protein [Polyangiaceae bacterium]